LYTGKLGATERQYCGVLGTDKFNRQFSYNMRESVISNYT